MTSDALRYGRGLFCRQSRREIAWALAGPGQFGDVGRNDFECDGFPGEQVAASGRGAGEDDGGGIGVRHGGEILKWHVRCNPGSHFESSKPVRTKEMIDSIITA